MSHNQDIGTGVEQLAQRCGNDTGLYLGTLLDTLGNAAIELVTVLVLDRSLVAASSQCHIQRLTCKFLCLEQALGIPAHTNGEGCRHLIVCVNFTHSIQNGKSLFHNRTHITLFKGYKITVLLQFFDDTVIVFDITFDLILDFTHDLGALVFTCALQKLLVVIDQDDCRYRTGREILFGYAFKLIIIDQINYIQAIFFLTGRRMICCILVAFIFDTISLCRTVCLKVNARKILCQTAVLSAKHFFPHLVIVPDDLTAAARNQNRQREISKCLIGIRRKLFFHRLIKLVDALVHRH